MKFFTKQMNKKGFSLIELIVVIAILAIIAAVAIPRFAQIQAKSEVRADAATASEIVNAARIYYVENGTEPTLVLLISGNYLADTVRDAQSDAGAPGASPASQFTLGGTGPTDYTCSWTPDNGATANLQTVTENIKWTMQ
jgi:prepilin-type N-terminal cleavage/methylation domain-containing protein